MLSAKGKIEVSKDSVRIVLDSDFCKYYKWFFDRFHYFTIKTQIPKHGAHIGIANPKIHTFDVKKVEKYNNLKVIFHYDFCGNYGGFKSKKFINYWFNIECPVAEKIANILDIPHKKGYNRFHITILNTKNIKK